MKRCGRSILKGLIFGLCLAPKAQAQTDFIIGMMYDPPLSSNRDTTSTAMVNKDLLRYEQAKDAGFNLLTGIRQGHVDVAQDSEIYPLFLAHKAGLKYILHDRRIYKQSNIAPADVLKDYTPKRLGNLYSTLYGIWVIDEPAITDVDFVHKWVSSIKRENEKWIPFVNLYPRYAFSSETDFTRYLNTYLGKQEQQYELPVACYDNYYQFETNSYYTNLRKMRLLAGQRPMWCYVRTTEQTTKMDKELQGAYMRLGAFAPIAYGAKGILYYSYDCVCPDMMMVDYSYHTKVGWDKTIYFDTIPTDDYQLFIEDVNGDGKKDIVVHTAAQNGQWLIDRAENGYGKWDDTFSGYGTTPSSIFYVADMDGDKKADLLALTNEGKLMVDYAQNGFGHWDKTFALRGVSTPNISRVSQKLLAVGDYDGDGQTDLAVGLGSSVAIFGGKRTGDQFSIGASSTILPTPNVSQLLTYNPTAGTRLLAFSVNQSTAVCYTFGGDSSSKKWNSSRPVRLGNPATSPAYFWTERLSTGDLLCAQDKVGYIWQGALADNKNVLELKNRIDSHSSSVIHPFSTDLNGDGHGTDDDICGVASREMLTSALLDKLGNPTPLWTSAKTINTYIREQLAPIVMQSKWLGAYHQGAYLPCEQGETFDNVSSSKLVNSMSMNLLCGIFEQSDCYYMILVNKSNKRVANNFIVLERNFHFKCLPRMSAMGADWNISQNAKGAKTEIRIPVLEGGECMALRLDKP